MNPSATSSHSNVALKVRLIIPGLEPPWLAYLHRGRDNMVFFYNPDSRISLWKDEFVTLMRGNINIPNIDIAIHSALVKLDSMLTVPTSNNSSDTAMETGTAAGTRNTSHLLEDSLSDLRDSLDQTVSDSEINFICIFDTSGLVEDPSNQVLKRCINRRVACVFPYQLIRELDRLKSRNDGTEQKARRVIRQIEECEKVHSDLLVRESSFKADCNKLILNGQSVNFVVDCPDDKMLKCACALVLEAYHKRGDDAVNQIFFVTNDKNLRQKAIGHSLHVLTTKELLSKLDMVNDNRSTSNLKKLFDGYRRQSQRSTTAKPTKVIIPTISRPKQKGGMNMSAGESFFVEHVPDRALSVSMIERPTPSDESHCVPKSYPGRYAAGTKHPVEYNGQRPKSMPRRFSFSNDNYYPSQSNVLPPEANKPIQKKQPLKMANGKNPSSTPIKKTDSNATRKPKSNAKKLSIKIVSTPESLANHVHGKEDDGQRVNSSVQSPNIQTMVLNNDKSLSSENYVLPDYPESQKFLSLWTEAVKLAVNRLGDAEIRRVLSDLHDSVQRFLFDGYNVNAFQQVVSLVMTLHQLCRNDNQVMDPTLLVQEVGRQGESGTVVKSCGQFFTYIQSVAEQFQSV